jgi:hypothetical protein
VTPSNLDRPGACGPRLLLPSRGFLLWRFSNAGRADPMAGSPRVRGWRPKIITKPGSCRPAAHAAIARNVCNTVDSSRAALSNVLDPACNYARRFSPRWQPSVSSSSPPKSVEKSTRARGDRNLFGDVAKAGPFLKLIDVPSAIPSSDPDDVTFWETDKKNCYGISSMKFATNLSEVLKTRKYSERQLQRAQRNDDRVSQSFVRRSLVFTK